MNINFYENEVKRYSEEIIHLEKELNVLYKEGYQDGFMLGALPKDEYLKEEENIKKHIENAEAKLEENNRIVTAYKNVIANMTALRSLRETNVDFNHPEVKEEVERRNKEIEEARKILSPDLIKDIEEMFVNEANKQEEVDKEDNKDVEELFDNNDKDKKEGNGFVIVENLQDNRDRDTSGANNTSDNDEIEQDQTKDEPTNTNAVGFPIKKDVLDIQPEKVDAIQVPSQNKDFIIPEEADIIDIPAKEQKPIKVTKRKVWNWVKKNKKKILIALGITAITISVIVLISQLVPAIAALAQAQQLSTLSGTMLNNAASWHGLSSVGQSALHLANEGLANTVATLTGKAAVFNSTTGIWSFAGMELGNLAASASAAVTAEIAKVAAISKTAAMLGTGGLGALGLGLLSNRKKDKVKSEPVAEVETVVEEPDLEVEPTIKEPQQLSPIYVELNAYIDELISYYRAGNEVDMPQLEGLLNYLYHNIEKRPELSEEEKKLLVKKLNSFSEELSASKGKGM